MRVGLIPRIAGAYYSTAAREELDWARASGSVGDLAGVKTLRQGGYERAPPVASKPDSR